MIARDLCGANPSKRRVDDCITHSEFKEQIPRIFNVFWRRFG
jgi:hypothetical protein